MFGSPFHHHPGAAQAVAISRNQTFRNWQGSYAALQRGFPTPLGPDEMRSPPFRPTVPNGFPHFYGVDRFDWGAAGMSVARGYPFQNPIGGGVVVAQKFRVCTDPGGVATILNGAAAYWGPQMVNFGIQPSSGGPLYTPANLAALYGPEWAQGAVPVTFAPPF